MIWVTVAIRPLVSDIIYASFMKSHDIEALRLSISANGGDTLRLTDLATYYIRKGDPASAYPLLIEAINHSNGDIVPWGSWLMRGICEAKMGQFKAAIKSVDRALQYNPNFINAQMLKKELDKTQKKK